MTIQYENKDICKNCGVCCKKCGCDYIPSDFSSMNYKDLYERLEMGDISIVSAIIFDELKNGKLVMSPFLYLRARNINRDIVDLISMKTTCSMLNEDGCSYDIESRPTGGVNLIPEENMKCYPLENPRILLKEWERYQKVLSKLVKAFTGLSVDAKIRIDIENLFFDVMNGNFEGVSALELEDIQGMIPLLVRACPDEYSKALNRCNGNIKVKRYVID